jgi:S-adenosylmethionine synthetase
VERQALLRKDGRLPWLRPDANAATIQYVDGKPYKIDTNYLTQHSWHDFRRSVKLNFIEEIIKPMLPPELIKGDIKYLW